eukprot:2134795-Karenia_brevis.AAC.1
MCIRDRAFKELMQRNDCEVIRTCICAFGARWRKATEIVSWGLSIQSLGRDMLDPSSRSIS